MIKYIILPLWTFLCFSFVLYHSLYEGLQNHTTLDILLIIALALFSAICPYFVVRKNKEIIVKVPKIILILFIFNCSVFISFGYSIYNYYSFKDDFTYGFMYYHLVIFCLEASVFSFISIYYKKIIKLK
jgi:hypothetical protein